MGSSIHLLGRVTAVGLIMIYGFNLGKIPINRQWSHFHEFDVTNRAEGDVGMLTVTLPLSGAGH